MSPVRTDSHAQHTLNEEVSETCCIRLGIGQEVFVAAGHCCKLILGLPCLGRFSVRGSSYERFLGAAFFFCTERSINWEKPSKINTDKAGCYTQAIRELKKEGKCPQDVEHRQIKYLNNVIEAEHGKLKQLIKPVRGFKTMRTAYATIKGFKVMRALRKGQGRAFNLTRDPIGEKRMIERAFGVGQCVMTEAMTTCQSALKFAPL